MHLSMRVLLVEPDYPTKFPPLGLLKISTYHKQRGDKVEFTRGLYKTSEPFIFDRVYITSLFSFYHSKTVASILHYKHLMNGDIRRVIVGGIYATLNAKEIYELTGIYPHVGLLDKPGLLGDDDIIVDNLVPDYELLDEVPYNYSLKDAYFGYATRGCPNKCKFCAVSQLEPNFKHYCNLGQYLEEIKEKFGEKQHLVLMDNNVLASSLFEDIIEDIKKFGFIKGAKRNGKMRIVDFNQGLDARRINDHNAELLSEVCIRPIRLAYDNPHEGKTFERAVRILAEHGMTKLSAYLLYNYLDTPADLYSRLKHIIDLNEELGTEIYSFPMRYTPITQKDRRYVGKNWSAKQIRGLQCILNVTKGIVSHRSLFFWKAFGGDSEEFEELILMPDDYVLYRLDHEKNSDTQKWKGEWQSLSQPEKDEFLAIVRSNSMVQAVYGYYTTKSENIRTLLDHYFNSDNQKDLFDWREHFKSLTPEQKSSLLEYIASNGNGKISKLNPHISNEKIHRLVTHYNGLQKKWQPIH